MLSTICSNCRFSLVLPLIMFSGLFAPSAIANSDTTGEERSFFDGIQARNIGPWRGGRVTAVAGTTANPYVYFMGATGGLWKTTNAGADWVNVSDKFFKTGPIGAVDIAPSDVNVVVAGTGESPFRGVMSAQGDGVYRSTDGGKTWAHIGLEDSRQIGAIKIHPADPDTIWVAVQGGAWAGHSGRGVWKTTDGGQNWRLVLETPNETTGAVDLKYDPSNPRILYATLWDMQRQAWEIRSGGAGSGVYKSVDGGESWQQLKGNGLPENIGKSGVAPSPAKSGRVWVVVEAKEEEAGLYRSDNGGASWSRINSASVIRSRAWYYMHIHADPVDEDTVYVLNSPFMKSVDGGKSFSPLTVPHVDVHALWINPKNTKWMINGNDGGANVSFDGGVTWSTQNNQPTGQFYRVNTDNAIPYMVYGAQQDNTTLAVRSRGYDGSIGREDFEILGGCENGYMAFDPDNPRFIYSGCYLGLIEEYDRKTNTARSIQAYESFGIGVEPKNARYRANWNAPIIVSAHDPSVIYHANQVVLKSNDRGFGWSEISSDLTRDEKDKQGKMGRPYSNENIEVYNTIFSLAESPHDAGVLWAGSDDGLIHATEDGGASWRDVTPRGLERSMINSLEISPHDPATVFAAVHKFKSGDDTPYIYRTENGGKRWKLVTKGIPANEYVRVVREDPERQGLLYAGTERGLHVSFDNGDHWQSLQLNIPAIPITDLKVQGNDLVMSTQGRGFWIIDDLSPLRQWQEQQESSTHLYAPSPGVRWASGGGQFENEYTSPNPPAGAVVYYALPEAPDLNDTALSMELLNSSGKVIRSLSSDAKVGNKGGRGKMGYALPAEQGVNRAVWDLRTDPVTMVPGLFQFGAPPGGAIPGYVVPPGDYTVRLTYGEISFEQPLTIEWDPTLEHTTSAIDEQQQYLQQAFDMLDEVYRSVLTIQTVKEQLNARVKILEKMPDQDDAMAAAKALVESIEGWESSVINRKRSNGQNVLAHEPQLNFKLFTLMGSVNNAMLGVTQGQRQRFDDLQQAWREAMDARDQLLAGDIAEFNQAVNAPILVPPISSE